MLDIGSLRIFKAVAELGSVSKAADRLCCVQSNVTTRLHQIEDELGVQLFYRKPRGMVLTPAGRTLVKYANMAVRSVEDAKRAVRDGDWPRGSVFIGTTETAAAIHLPAVFARYHREYPDVDLHVTTNTSNCLVGQVHDYTLDMAIVNGPVNDPSIEQVEVFEEELVLGTDFGTKSLAALEKRILLVSPSGCTCRARLEQWMHESGILPFRIMEFSALEVILGCVAAGMGITLLPISVIRKLRFEDKIRIHPIPEPYRHVSTYMVRRKDAIQTPAMIAFAEMVAHENQNEARRGPRLVAG